MKNPYFLAFIGLEEKASYTETDLESAIINHLKNWSFLRRLSLKNPNNLLDVNIKYYYSKTHSAYTFIENLSRFLIAFIIKL